METLAMNSLPLMLSKRSSVLDGITLLEVIPIKRIKALIKSNLLLLSWGEDYNWDFHKKLIMEQYANEKDQIQKYLQNYNKVLGAVAVKYGKPKHKWGRAFPYKSLGLSCIRRVIRNSLINGIYYDFDISNAQPQIIRNLCESNNIPCPIIKRYCVERSQIKRMVAEHYGVSEDTAKELFIRLCFFGTFGGWCMENKISNKPALEFIILFERELKDIAERAKKQNTSLYETARKKKEDGGEVKENKVLGSFFALYNQEYESRIVEAVMCYLINQTPLMKHTGINTPVAVGAYEYDGIKLLKENVDAYEGGIEAVVDLLNEKTFELTGFRLEWTNKPFEEVYNLDEWIEADDDDKPNEDLIADCKIIRDTLNNADCGIIETIMSIKPNHYIYSVEKMDSSKGDWYGWNDTRWEKSDAPLRKAIMYEVPKYWRGIMEKWDAEYADIVFEEGDEPDSNYNLWEKTKKAMEERIFMLKSAGGVSACVSVAKTLMANYTLEFDANPDLFGCENGVIDIEDECFRPYRFDDFITFSCGYDFTPLILDFKVQTGTKEKEVEGKKMIEPVFRQVEESDISSEHTSSFDFIMNIYKQIFPDEELRNYFFKIISTGMSGRAIEKFFVFNGAGRNGKGLTNEFLEKVFGSYFTNVSPLIFSESQKQKTSSGPNPELAKLDKKRYIVSKEPPKDAPFHNSVIKDLTGGGNTSARMCNSNKSNVKLCGTFVCEANVKPNFSEAPQDADAERINDILFGSKFCISEEEWDETTGKTNYIYKLDAGLKEKLIGSIVNKNTMLNILISNLLMVKEKGYNVDAFKPDSVKKRSLTYLQNSYDIHNIFTTLFELRCEENKDKYIGWNAKAKGDEDWTLPKIASHIRKSKDFAELPKSKQKEYKAEDIEQFFMKNNFYKSVCYNDTNKHAWRIRGWRLKPEEEEEDD
jgi:phage/plasmid-associated DNA primase